jgi:serine/threonine protein kinase
MSSEADIMSRLDHPHIIKLHEVIDSTSSNKIYLIMDYASKGSLADLIPLTEQLARRYFKQLMSGLTYLHKVARVAHKDIKPDNLLIDSDDRLRIGDFGSSQNLVEGMMEVSGSVSTYAFMAPELVRGDPNISGEAVDVWASGVTLYYLIVGKLPFHTKKLQQLYEAIKTQEVSFPESMSKECVSLLTGMLEKDPAVRFKVEDIVRCDWVKS